MTENANLESKKLSHQVGSMAVKGMVGAISIAAISGRLAKSSDTSAASAPVRAARAIASNVEP